MELKALKAHLALFLWFAAAWCARAADGPHVVLITIDGFPARMFWDAKTSRIVFSIRHRGYARNWCSITYFRTRPMRASGR